MNSFPLEVPEAVTFEQAIALAQSLLSQAEAGGSQPKIAAAIAKRCPQSVIAELVKTENGARGFFVTYLPSEVSIADNPPPAVVQALGTSPDVVADLLAKNLAMSTAQAVFHSRNQKEDLALGSERVSRRTAHLIELLDLPAVYECCQKLLESATTGEGSYKGFLERWGYDNQQRQEICQALQQVLHKT